MLDERHLVCGAERAVQLQCSRRHVVQHLLHHGLHRGDIGPHGLIIVVLVYLPRRLQCEEPEGLDLHPRVGDHLLHELLVAE
jgi:hypothetical protein